MEIGAQWSRIRAAIIGKSLLTSGTRRDDALLPDRGRTST
jgi:hypothetical protein